MIDKFSVQQAWNTRTSNFPPLITFHYPVLTWTVSVTGDKCELNCAHCGGYFLNNMIPLNKLNSKSVNLKKNVSSLLISGGCNKHGKVPLVKYLNQIEYLKFNYKLRLNFHTGLIGEEEAALLKNLADTVSFDFIGSDATIYSVLGIPLKVEDYISSYLALKKYTRVIPHICIGLNGGRIRGEYSALDVLEGLGVEELVFIVFMPVPGTNFEKLAPPNIDEVVNLLAHARVRFPEISLRLGCMRPGGKYRIKLDYWAVKCGINSIVMPAREAEQLANNYELKIYKKKECCVL